MSLTIERFAKRYKSLLCPNRFGVCSYRFANSLPPLSAAGPVRPARMDHSDIEVSRERTDVGNRVPNAEPRLLLRKRNYDHPSVVVDPT